jgi:hypothetical protein
MVTLLSMFVAVIASGWKSVGGQLLASAVLLLSGHQNLPRKGAHFRVLMALGADFWFFIALAFSISALGTAIWMKLWVGVAICAVVLSLEAWLIQHWNRTRSGACH